MVYEELKKLYSSHYNVPLSTKLVGVALMYYRGRCIVYMCHKTHERSVIETRQSKATTSEDNSLFLKRERRAASGGTRTCDVLHTRQTLCQLSHRGSSAGQVESFTLSQYCVHCTIVCLCCCLICGLGVGLSGVLVSCTCVHWRILFSCIPISPGPSLLPPSLPPSPSLLPSFPPFLPPPSPLSLLHPFLSLTEPPALHCYGRQQ